MPQPSPYYCDLHLRPKSPFSSTNSPGIFYNLILRIAYSPYRTQFKYFNRDLFGLHIGRHSFGWCLGRVLPTFYYTIQFITLLYQ